ncbi:MAG: hypothetical protein P8R42_02520 [Candidatus Binatia bacterium]|nr:hypothetical protein [Candidatus Binatia bacterium]
MAEQEAWEDLNFFRMEDADAWKVIEEAPGSVVTFARKDGHTIGVWVSHAVIDDVLYVTTTANRPKTRAWERDPRMSACFAVPGLGSVTVVGRVELGEQPELRRKFLEALCDRLEIAADARESWISKMDTDGRVIGKVEVEKLITFDERKLEF